MQTHIDLAFADGTYRFALGLAQINEIQLRCKTGIGAVYARVLAGRIAGDIEVGHPEYGAYHYEDLIETVRQGLIGGAQAVVDGQTVAVSGPRVTELIDNYALAMPISELWKLAAAILFAKIEGYAPPPGEEHKKKDVAEGTTGEGGSITPAP